MDSTDRLFEKYLKVKALAEGGEGGEQSNAQRIADRMEHQHAWLRGAYEQRAQEAAEAFSEAQGQSAEGFPASWYDIFTTARNVYSKVSDFADTVSQARIGSILAETVKARARISSAGNLIIGVSIPESTLDELEDCNLTQIRVFRNQVLAQYTAELNEALGLED
jgi:hypothetical protein